MKLNAHQLRTLSEHDARQTIERRAFSLILDNVYDTYNIGGLFRLADALAMEKIYLCGMTDTPPNHKIKKASIGTYKIVPWEYAENTLEVIKKLKIKNKISQKKTNLIAIEQHEKAVPYNTVDYQFPLALIVGNETSGISQEVLTQCDRIVEIPMYGINKSLNVIVSAGIVSYHIVSRINLHKDNYV